MMTATVILANDKDEATNNLGVGPGELMVPSDGKGWPMESIPFQHVHGDDWRAEMENLNSSAPKIRKNTISIQT